MSPYVANLRAVFQLRNSYIFHHALVSLPRQGYLSASEHL